MEGDSHVDRVDCDGGVTIGTISNQSNFFRFPINQIIYDLGKKNKWLRAGHINARSVPKHIHELRRLVYRGEFDVMCISETFIKEDTPNACFNIDNYRLYRHDRTHTTQGGVGIYVKDNIKVAKQLHTPKHIVTFSCITSYHN